MLFGFFLTFGVAVLSAGLRSFQKLVCAKGRRARDSRCHFSRGLFYHRQLDMGFYWRDELALLPWLEILTRIRALRLPREKRLRPKSPPSSDTFPALSEITREIEDEGFVHVGDAGWDWEDYRQFFPAIL